HDSCCHIKKESGIKRQSPKRHLSTQYKSKKMKFTTIALAIYAVAATSALAAPLAERDGPLPVDLTPKQAACYQRCETKVGICRRAACAPIYKRCKEHCLSKTLSTDTQN
ncbi:hypothetical protein BC937DRAFT_87362, partial [Endogone sp. FLAS-F59071]